MAVLSRTFLSWRRYLQRQAARAGCSIQQYYVLKQLVRREFLRPSDIATELYCDRPTATVVIRNLVSAGWVLTVPDPEDRRQRQVRITEAGRSTFEAAEKIVAEAWAALDPLSCLTEDEARRLLSTLRNMEKHIALGSRLDRRGGGPPRAPAETEPGSSP